MSSWADGDGQCFETRMGPDFFQNTLNIVSHGDPADAEVIRYPFRIHPFSKMMEKFPLPFAQEKEGEFWIAPRRSIPLPFTFVEMPDSHLLHVDSTHSCFKIGRFHPRGSSREQSQHSAK